MRTPLLEYDSLKALRALRALRALSPDKLAERGPRTAGYRADAGRGTRAAQERPANEHAAATTSHSSATDEAPQTMTSFHESAGIIAASSPCITLPARER